MPSAAVSFADSHVLWWAFFVAPPVLAVIMGVGLWVAGPNQPTEEGASSFWEGFYMVRQERPRWPISVGHMVEVLPPYRRGHGIVLWWFREKREDEHDWGWIPHDAIQFGWGKPRTIGTWVPEDIASWQAPEDDDEVEAPAEAPSAGSAG